MSRIMVPPKNVHILIFRTCEYVRLHGKGELKLLISWPAEGDVILGFSGGCDVITSICISGRGKQKLRERERERDLKMQCCWLWRWKETSQGLRAGFRSWKGKIWILLQSLQKEMQPSDTLISVHWAPFRTSDLFWTFVIEYICVVLSH